MKNPVNVYVVEKKGEAPEQLYMVTYYMISFHYLRLEGTERYQSLLLAPAKIFTFDNNLIIGSQASK